MKTCYAELSAGQEDPELMPNEVAFHLSQLLGYEHFTIHRVLLEVNPALYMANEQWYLSDEELPAILPVLRRHLLPENFFTPLITPLPCPTPATATV
jgi:hypothetical protein